MKQIWEYYDAPRPHINTLSTIVRNLEEKGYLDHRAYGNSYQYYAVISQDEFKKQTLRNVISKYFNNSYLDVVSAFVNEEDISVDELKKLIRAAKNTKR